MKNIHKDIYNNADGTETILWSISGTYLFHNENGPAIILPDKEPVYCLNGTEFRSRQEWFEALSAEQQEKLLFNSDVMAEK